MSARPVRVDLRPLLERDDRRTGRIVVAAVPLRPASDAAPGESTRLDRAGVEQIASRGFPLKETTECLLFRNKRITWAYGDLARQLTEVIAATGAGVRVANWCTFAAWSSKTIGCTIDPAEIPLGVRRLPPGAVRTALTNLVRRLGRRHHGATFRALASGNRFIFLEVASLAAVFIEHFGTDGNDPAGNDPAGNDPAGNDPAGNDRDRAEARWSAFWAEARRTIAGIERLDPGWVPSEPPDGDLLERGMRAYFEALGEPDRDRQIERVLVGNLYIGAYEQWRADGYIAATLAINSHRAFRDLLSRRTGRSRRALPRRVNRFYGRVMTRTALRMLLPGDIIHLGQPLVAARQPDGSRAPRLFPGDLATIADPELQALLSRFDLGDFDTVKRGARNWLEYTERMHVITNLFRSRHEDQHLLGAALFSDQELVTILGSTGPTAPPAA